MSLLELKKEFNFQCELFRDSIEYYGGEVTIQIAEDIDEIVEVIIGKCQAIINDLKMQALD
ncbi:MAG: hypothetical protein KF746_27525 [Chitinophagaceae bacterium]|nr:hypothetical protein [Chitinophagaceae bacterium]